MIEVTCGKNRYSTEEVIEQYHDMLYRLAMIRINHSEDAKDVVQDTFMKLLIYIKKGHVFQDEEHLKAWLLTVAVNRGKSMMSLAWNRKTEGLENVKEMSVPEVPEQYAYEYVLKLPEKYRIVINLFYYEQLSTDQIAAIIKQKPATVRSYLHRGREKLKKMMEEDGYVG